MSQAALLQLIAAALLLAAGILNLLRAGRMGDEGTRRNWRTRGWLFIAAGALFLILALGFADA